MSIVTRVAILDRALVLVLAVACLPCACAVAVSEDAPPPPSGGAIAPIAVAKLRDPHSAAHAANGARVIAGGAIVTAVTHDLLGFFMQDPVPMPWAGIYVYSGRAGEVSVGDVVVVTGVFSQPEDRDQIDASDAADGRVDVVGAALPPDPVDVAIDDIAYQPQGPRVYELQSMLARITDVVVTNYDTTPDVFYVYSLDTGATIPVTSALTSAGDEWWTPGWKDPFSIAPEETFGSISGVLYWRGGPWIAPRVAADVSPP